MTIKVKDDTGTLRTITRGSVMVDGVLRPLKSVKVKDNTGTLRTVFSGLKASSNFPSFSAFGTTEPVISSPVCIVTPTGGTGPYTYAWTVAATDGNGTPVAVSPTSSTTTFQATGLFDFIPHEVTFRCTVTDSGGVTGSVDVLVTFQKLGSFL